MTPSNMVAASAEDFPFACVDGKLNLQTRTQLSAWAPEFSPNSAAQLEDAYAGWAFSGKNAHVHKDGNVYNFNFDLVSDDESESDDEVLPSTPVLAGKPICPPPGLEAELGTLIDPPPGLEVPEHAVVKESAVATGKLVKSPTAMLADAPWRNRKPSNNGNETSGEGTAGASKAGKVIGAPPGLEAMVLKPEPCLAIGAPPGLESPASQQSCLAPSVSVELEKDTGPPPGLEAKQRTPWWRRPCPFNVPQNVREPALTDSPESRPWRHVAGRDMAHNLACSLSLDYVLKDAVPPTDITKEILFKSASESDIGDADTTGSFTTEDIDSE